MKDKSPGAAPNQAFCRISASGKPEDVSRATPRNPLVGNHMPTTYGYRKNEDAKFEAKKILVTRCLKVSMGVTLVFEVLQDLPAIGANAGDMIVCEPGAIPPESDLMIVRHIPRGRLGHLLGADLDGLIRLCDPPASLESASELLTRLLRPVSSV